MTYGFRLFELELVEHHRNSPEPQNWVLPDQSHYADHADAALAVLCSTSRRLEAKPTWNHGRGQDVVPPFTASAGSRVVHWISSSRVNTTHLRAEIGYGTVGSHSTALADTGAPTDLSKYAPSNYIRIELLLPSPALSRR